MESIKLFIQNMENQVEKIDQMKEKSEFDLGYGSGMKAVLEDLKELVEAEELSH